MWTQWARTSFPGMKTGLFLTRVLSLRHPPPDISSELGQESATGGIP